jgi:hypothetical protein
MILGELLAGPMVQTILECLNTMGNVAGTNRAVLRGYHFTWFF